MKKITSLILCIVLTVAALTALSVAVFADEGETPAVSDVTLNGYQNKNGGFDIRIVGKIANEANYREVGFVFSNGTTSKECAAKYMFKTLLASDGENTYEALTAGEGEYLFAYIIEGIEKSAALTLSVKPYAVNQDNEKIYGEEKTLVKKANEQFAQETVHTHTPIHHEATTATAASYATAWNMEYWSCEGCSKLFSDAACTTVVEADAVMAPAQKDNAAFVNSETNPYLLANAADYEAYAAAVNGGDNMSGKYAKLTADIGTEEAPITVILGNASGKPYSGIMDGDGHTICINVTSKTAVGLIGYAGGATVKNLTVTGNVQLTARNMYAGGFVGMVLWQNGNMTTLTNCVNEAVVNVTAISNAAGFVGRTLGNLTITGCENHASITTEGNYAAGIVGYVHKSDSGSAPSLTITDTVNTGDITGKTGIAGIVGLFMTGASGGTHRLTNVSNTGKITGTAQVGGIIATVSSKAANGFDLTITYRNAGCTDADGTDIVIGSDGNKQTTSITKIAE